jgi:hypothetical protein
LRDLKRFLVPKTNFTVFQQRLFREDQSDPAQAGTRFFEVTRNRTRERILKTDFSICFFFNGGDDT